SSSTVTGNTAGGTGGGIVSTAGTATIRNTLVAQNLAATDPDVVGTFASQGHNLIGDGTGGAGFTSSGDQVGNSGAPIAPHLGLLQDNGGPTQTMALLAGSPAIDAGDNAAPPGVYDQRGIGYPRITGGALDIGAFEVRGATPFTLFVQNTQD